MRKAAAALLAVLALAALAASPASAKKTHLLIETFGSAAQPEFLGSTALAVDQSNGDLLVLDQSPANTLSRYKPNGESDPFSALGTNVIDAKKGAGNKACGEESSSCDQTPQNGFSFGGFQSETQIAVDNSGTATDGNIYVTQFEKAQGNLVDIFASTGEYLGQLTEAEGVGFGLTENEEGKVLRFGPCGVAVDEEGNVFVAGGYDEQLYRFDPTANPPTNADGALLATPPGNRPVCSLAAGAGPSAGALFANTSEFTTGASNSLFKLNAVSGSLEGTFDPGENKVIAVDPLSGHVFETGRESRELTASGTLVSTFTTTGRGIAVDGSAERVYISSQAGGGQLSADVRVLGPVVTVPEVVSGSYEVTGDTSVRVKGTVNPDGQALSECSFEYDTTQYFSAPHGQIAPCEAPDAAEVGAGAGPVEVHADLTGLAKETTYHYRLVATNPNAALYPEDPDAIVKGKDQTFKTPAKPGIKALWASDVLPTEAGLNATLNPENSPTTYRFEWGLDSSYGNSSAEFSLGSGGADHTVGIHLGELEPATTYHYRLVATNGIGITESADLHFTTYAVPVPPGAECENASSRIGFGSQLPDCRAYEMVSPLDKEGGDIRVFETSVGPLAVLEQSSLSGEKLAYGSARSFGGAASAPATSQYIAQRVEGEEWQTHPIDSPRGRSVRIAASQVESEFKAFSSDLCEAWQVTFAEPPLAEGALAGYENLYRRTDQLCSEDGTAQYEALAPIIEPEGVAPGDAVFRLLMGASAESGEATFNVNGPQIAAYLSAQGSPPRRICVLPDGRALESSCTAGSLTGTDEPEAGQRALSADGARVFWTTPSGGVGKLYLRENPAAPESARLHGAASGEGNLIGPAAGKGNVVSGSELVKGAKAESGAFAVGQEISAASGGIPAKATIVKVEETSPATFTLTLSAKATKTKPSDTLTGLASEKVAGILTETGAFEAGQEISGGSIPPGTTVLSCSPACGPGATSLTLSAKAGKTEAAAALSATSPCTEAATKACTIPVSGAAEEEAGTKASSFFWGAAADGSAAVFTVMTGAESNANKLYSFDVEDETTTPIAEGIYGVMGVSEDASRVYFASSKVLSEEANSNGDKAQAGEPNLYLYEAGGGFSFIATLGGADLRRLGFEAQGYREAATRVSPDGAHATFVSMAPLTGYDNKAARDGKAFGSTYASGDALPEVYRYDAATKTLLCASCNPSGGRPAAPSRIPKWETGLHAARVLAEDGARLYFESADALTPRDANGAVDVYQWEAPGAGSCEESSPTYSLQNGGCIDLVSSGQSHLDSRFVEASPSGDDVFFATGSSLLPQDPGGFDIYDARAGGGLPIPAGPAPGCEGEACQSPVEAPNDPTPASSSFEGAGNVVEEAPPARRPCAKGKVKRHGKCVAKKHKKAAKGAKRNRRAGR